MRPIQGFQITHRSPHRYSVLILNFLQSLNIIQTIVRPFPPLTPPKPPVSLHANAHSVPQEPQNKPMTELQDRVYGSSPPHRFPNPVTASDCPIIHKDFAEFCLLLALLSDYFLNPYLPLHPQCGPQHLLPKIHQRSPIAFRIKIKVLGQT